MVDVIAPRSSSQNPVRFEVGTPGQAVAPLADIREGFRSAYVFELQDTRRANAVVRAHVLALNPRRYVLSEPFQSTLTPTENDTVVAEENGLIIRELTLEGTTGLRVKAAKSFGGSQGTLSGTEHFFDLRNLFRFYSRLKKGNVGPFIRMVFHSLREDDHFVVVPRQFETPRDAKATRMHYDYRITLAVIGEAESGLSQRLELGAEIDPFSSRLGEMAKDFNDSRAAFAEVTANISEVKRKVGNINSVMIQAAGLFNAVGNMLRAGTGLIDYPFSLIASVRDQIDAAGDDLEAARPDFTAGTLGLVARQLRRMSDAAARMSVRSELFGPDPLEQIVDQFEGENRLTGDDLARGESGANIGSRTRITVGSGREAGLDLGEFRGVQQHRLIRTDTIQSLAVQFQTTPELIVLVNDLKFPYLTEGGGPGILKPGDLILIPSSEGETPTTVQPKGEYLTADEALFGVDLALDATALRTGQFEIKVNESGAKDDAELSRGTANVVQGTEISVQTERGTTTYVPEVGIRRSVGTKGTIQHMLLAAINLREAILSDPRIDGIQDSTIVLDNDVLTQEITPRLIGEREGVTLVLPFGKATGEV